MKTPSDIDTTYYYLSTEEILDDLFARHRNMSYEDYQYLQEAYYSSGKLVSLHLTLGMSIRNHYNLWYNHPRTMLWRQNGELPNSPDHPDAYSFEIINEFLGAMFKDTPRTIEEVINQLPPERQSRINAITEEILAEQEELESKLSFDIPRDELLPSEQQGAFSKYNLITRVDGGHLPGNKHHNCRYFVLDLDHDPHAAAAMSAYAYACKNSHPKLSADIAKEFPLGNAVVQVLDGYNVVLTKDDSPPPDRPDYEACIAQANLVIGEQFQPNLNWLSIFIREINRWTYQLKWYEAQREQFNIPSQQDKGSKLLEKIISCNKLIQDQDNNLRMVELLTIRLQQYARDYKQYLIAEGRLDEAAIFDSTLQSKTDI